MMWLMPAVMKMPTGVKFNDMTLDRAALLVDERFPSST
jgi:hypothetical protein